MSILRMTFVTKQAVCWCLYYKAILGGQSSKRACLRTLVCLVGAPPTIGLFRVISDTERHIRVLVIDRHEGVRRALRMRLSAPEHLDVIGDAADPLDAAEKLRLAKPDVVVFGLHRSSEDELARTVRAVHDMAHNVALIIVLVPFADAVERELLMDAGAKRYLLKEIDSNQLIHEIESVASRPASV
jgi:AmiR/NasT family two-component response regulator